VNKKRKRNDRGTSTESVAQEKPTIGPAKSSPLVLFEPCGKCDRTNHITAECRLGTNKCMWCGSHNHLISAWPRRLKFVEKRSSKVVRTTTLGPWPPKPTTSRRVYVMGKKEVIDSSTVVTKTLFLNLKTFCVNLENDKV